MKFISTGENFALRGLGYCAWGAGSGVKGVGRGAWGVGCGAQGAGCDSTAAMAQMGGKCLGAKEEPRNSLPSKSPEALAKEEPSSASRPTPHASLMFFTCMTGV